MGEQLSVGQVINKWSVSKKLYLSCCLITV